MNLEALGFGEPFASAFAPHQALGRKAGRVAAEHKQRLLLWTEDGELLGRITGKLRHHAKSSLDFPAVGDWVAYEAREGSDAQIHALLPRRGIIQRVGAGESTEAQLIAANIDTLFLVTALDQTFSVRRLERFLAMTFESGATPICVLSKTDICNQIRARIDEVAAVARGVEIVPVSNVTGEGVEKVRALLGPGVTGALLGVSGVGKSTLLNSLLGESRALVQEVRAMDSKGRHTTTRRELFRLPNGGLVVDTPGLRGVQLWDTAEGLGESFDDVQVFTHTCRFRDCAHEQEPGCAVQAAVASGQLDAERLSNFLKLRCEARSLEERQTLRARMIQKRRGKPASRALGQNTKPR